MALEFSARIARIPLYPAAESYGREDLVLLASNESPYPPLAAVQEAIAAALPTLHRYPDPTNAVLRKRLSDRYDVPPERIAIGNGSCDILLAAGEALLEPGAELIYAWPSFSVYPHLAAASGARALIVALDREQRHDLAAMAGEITVATRLILICNPNNPTSTALPPGEIAQFLERVPEYACVILDEAYCEFNLLDDPSASVELLRRHPNLVLLRTFSKAYSLCGLRVGYALCGSERLVQALEQVRQPFYCNRLAQAGATAALDHVDEIEQRVAMSVAERVGMAQGLAALGLEVADSQANFCWVTGNALRDHEQTVLDALRERGFIVRAGAALGAPGHLRVSFGTEEQDERFLAALGEVLAQLPAGGQLVR
jgi:histidinol-phosphate aminotransferase